MWHLTEKWNEIRTDEFFFKKMSSGYKEGRLRSETLWVLVDVNLTGDNACT
jgi:hypothetical protein